MVNSTDSRISEAIPLFFTTCYFKRIAAIKTRMFIATSVLLLVMSTSCPEVYAVFRPEQHVIVQSETDRP